MKGSIERRRSWISLISWWLLASGVILAAAQLLGPLISGRWLLPMVVLLALAFLSTRFVEIESAWRFAGLLVFAMLAGTVLAGWASSAWQDHGSIALLLGLLAAGFGLAIGTRLPPVAPWLGGLISVVSWLYVGAWLLWWARPLPSLAWRLWAGFGFVLFLVLTALWAANRSRGEKDEDLVSATSQLLLLSLNLSLALLFVLAL